MGLFDKFKKKKDDDDDDDLPDTDPQTISDMYKKKLSEEKEKIYWNTGICWKCNQTMEPDSEFCWECGTKYKVKK